MMAHEGLVRGRTQLNLDDAGGLFLLFLTCALQSSVPSRLIISPGLTLLVLRMVLRYESVHILAGCGIRATPVLPYYPNQHTSGNIEVETPSLGEYF
jgi:hypothetical protein